MLDASNRVLLFRSVFDDGPLAGQAYWATPGGALEDGESYAAAARRELVEETGIVADVGEEIAQRDIVFRTPNGDQVAADERYFLVRVADDTVDESGQEPSEADTMKEYRWWPLTELGATAEVVFPEDIVQLVAPHLGIESVG